MAAVIGVASGAIGIWQFYQSLFAAHAASNIATVRIAVAINGNDASHPTSADGTIAQVRLYNENQQLIGSRAGSYIASGGFKDIAVSQTNNQQATFVQIHASNDAVCIPYITTTWVDGRQLGWMGDFGWRCGLDWHYGNLYVASGKDKPRCTWIDLDHTNNIKAGMIFIHFPSFDGAEAHSTNPTSYCGWPAFRAYTPQNVIFKRDADVAERKGKPKRAPDSRLIISSDPSHNATELCASFTSRGPDLVNLAEGVYCDMETSDTLPLCSDGVTKDCFDHVNKAKVGGEGAKIVGKVFSEVIEWE